jgi:AcrR family transcriptional regulator
MDSNYGRRRTAARNDGRAAYAQRRQEVLVAAADVFRELGYHATSMGEVADALGIDRATLYYYIGSKEELFQEVVRSALVANRDEADSIADSPGPPRERLARLIKALMVSYERHYPYLYVYLQENMQKVGSGGSDWAAEMAGYGDRYARAMAKIVHQGVDDGSFQDLGDQAVMTSAILGMVNWSHRWFAPGGTRSAAEIGDIMSRIALGGILSTVDTQ